MSKQKPRVNPFKTSIHLTLQDQIMLDYICKIYESNRGATMRRLITEAYSIIKYVEQK